MSIPGLCPAVERERRILVAGGVVNNFPVDVARDLCADIIIGVNLPQETPDRRSLATVTGSIAQLINLMVGRQEKVNEATLTERDILLMPQVKEIGLLDFVEAERAVELGGEAVFAARHPLGEIAAIQHTLKRKSGEDLAIDQSVINYDQLIIENESRVADEIILTKLDLPRSGAVDTAELKAKLINIYGLDMFGSVFYRVEESSSESRLVVIATKKPSGTSEYRAGLALYDDFEGKGDYVLSAGMSLTQLNDLAGRVDIETAFGASLGGRVVYEQPTNHAQTRYIQSSLETLSTSVPLYVQGDRVAEFRASQANAEIDFIWAPNYSLRTGIGLSYRSTRVKLTPGSSALLSNAGLNEDWEGGLRTNFLFDYDTLDSADLPHYGTQLVVRLGVDVGNSDQKVGQVLVDGLVANTLGAYTMAGFFTVDGELEPEGLVPHFLGGFQKLSGLSENQLFGNVSVLMGGRAYRSFAFDSLFGNEAFIGGSLEYGGVWLDWDDVDSDDALLHGSLFSGLETPLGPLFLALGFGEGGDVAAHFSLGSRF